MWATEEAKGALSAAIEAAKKVAENADALIEEIAKAKDDVTGAKEAYEGSQKPGTPDKTKLEDMIEAAGETGVTVSADGLDKDPTELWVTEERMNAFRSALADAEALMADDKATIKQIKAQTEALDEAIKSLKADAKAGTPDKSALEALLKDAKDAANNIMISENGGTDVEASDIWVTREVMETFDAAVKKADEVIGNADATMDEIDAAAENLAESIELLNRSKAKGAPDKTALITAIANAQAARDAVVVSEAGDGSDVDPDENWIDVSSAEKMDEAIKGAIAVLEDDGAKISEIASQVKKLTAIVSKITGKPGTPDKGGLTSAVSEAKLIEGNINVTSEDGSDVPTTMKWVKAEARDALIKAIEEAESILADPAAKKADIKAAEEKLAEARAAFDNAAYGSKSADKDAITPSDEMADKASEDASIPVINANKIKTTASMKKKTMKVSWTKSAKVSNYRIAYKSSKSKKWTYKWTKGKGAYTLTKLKKGNLYQFKIQGFVKGEDGSWSKSKWSNVSYRYMQNTPVKLKTGKKSITVSWNKVKGSSGYMIRYSQNKSMKNAKWITVKKASKTKYNIKKLKKGKTYYVQVRPIKKSGGKTYFGVLSKAKAVKVKK